jgi:hypothetical protein
LQQVINASKTMQLQKRASVKLAAPPDQSPIQACMTTIDAILMPIDAIFASF